MGSVCLWLLLLRSLAAEKPATAPLTTVVFDVPAGLCEAAFPLKLSADGLAIRYTTDGREPSPTLGSEYAAPLRITNTTILRAAAFRSGARVSPVATHSYLFLDQIKHQSPNPPGLPSGPNAWNGEPSFYAMDRRIVDDPAYRDRMTGALKALPVVSVVCAKADLFDSRRGIYVNSMDRGDSWERACSAEFIPPDGTPGFQVDCGLRIQGNYNRIPEKSPKHSFRLVFKKQYGPGKLRYRIFPDSPVAKFDTLC